MSAFTWKSPEHKAQCRVCRGGIEAGAGAILLSTYAAGKYLNLYFHPYCFPDKKEDIHEH